MFYTRAFLSSTLSPSLFALNFKSAFTLSFSCKSPPEWIFSHLFNQALLACSQTMDKHISTQINAAKQARNEETRRRNMRVHNCQRSRFGFVARQLCGHHRNIYGPIEIWPPLTILARTPCDKFINLASRGIIHSKYFQTSKRKTKCTLLISICNKMQSSQHTIIFGCFSHEDTIKKSNDFLPCGCVFSLCLSFNNWTFFSCSTFQTSCLPFRAL